ncbi:unnamed protein product [Camellia sinensis]
MFFTFRDGKLATTLLEAKCNMKTSLTFHDMHITNSLLLSAPSVTKPHSFRYNVCMFYKSKQPCPSLIKYIGADS